MRWILSNLLVCALAGAAELAPTDVTIVETVLRMEQFDLRSSEKAQGAVARYLDAKPGTENYFKLIERFTLRDRVPELIRRADKTPAGIEGIKLALKLDPDAVRTGLADDKQAPALMQALAPLRNAQAMAWIEAVAADSGRPDAVRELAGKLAGKKVEPGGAAKPVPKLAELMKETGNGKRGQPVFVRVCAVCHQPNNLGLEFGPGLAEIGDKLPREDLFIAILDPNAAISMGFEGYEVELKQGGILTGLIGSETDDALTVLLMGGVRLNQAKSDVARRTQLKTSLMPPGLHEAMTRQELVDLVAYLEGLKKKS